MSTYSDLVARAVSNIRLALMRAGAPGAIDEGMVEQVMVEVLGEIADKHDLDALTQFDVPLFTTATGVRTYPLPDDFGRLLTFKDPQQTGICLNNGTTESDLQYAQVLDFAEGHSDTNGVPSHFIITANGMALDPPPDANGSVGNYTVRGTYLMSLDYNTFDFEAQVRLMYPQALQDAVQLRYLGGDHMPKLAVLINGEQRKKQQFQWQYTPQSHRRWQRRGR